MKISQQMIDSITSEVQSLLSKDASGHGMDHVNRVTKLALSFAERENADTTIVLLSALLHDVDDYKLFGEDNANNLTNANKILDAHKVDAEIKEAVLDIIKTMGYNKYLQGIRPSTLEGKIVSDADMCDAIGAIGILRTHTYALSKGNEFFDKTIAPLSDNLSAEQYRAQTKSHSVQHFFDKLLRIPSILMTDAGKEEGAKRQAVMVDFLRQLFIEEGAEGWLDYLDKFEGQT